MYSAVVTGCAGFIGSTLTDKLLQKGWKVFGIDNFHSYYPRKFKEFNLSNAKKHSNFNFFEGSILKNENMKPIPCNVDYVFHFAAIAGVRYSIQHPEEYFEINVQGTRNVLEKFVDVKKIVVASSSSVYGNLSSNEFPVNENHPLNPISPYGESKKESEKVCDEFSEKYDTKITKLRFYTVFGPRQRPDEAIMKFIRLAQVQKPITVYGDGSKERDFTYVSDIVDGSILSALYGKGVYNLGTGKTVTVNEMISMIENTMKIKIKRNYVKSPFGDVEKTHADISKAKNELNYSPQFDLQSGIKECVKWCQHTTTLNPNID